MVRSSTTLKRSFPSRGYPAALSDGFQPLPQLLGVDAIFPIFEQRSMVELDELLYSPEQIRRNGVSRHHSSIVDRNRRRPATGINRIRRINRQFDPRGMLYVAPRGYENGVVKPGHVLAVRDHFFDQFPLCDFLGKA